MPAQGPCPNCSGQLVQVERSGVRIDACRQCRGVFLDRGELEEILKREHAYVSGASDDDDDFLREVSGKPQKQQGYGLDAQTAKKLFTDYQSHKQHKSSRRKKSVLDELFG